MTSAPAAKLAFLILSDSPDRALPGLVMAGRLRAVRAADVRVLFFGPGVKLLASGAADEHLAALREAGITPVACATNAEQYGVSEEVSSRPVELQSAGAQVEQFAHDGYTVLSF